MWAGQDSGEERREEGATFPSPSFLILERERQPSPKDSLTEFVPGFLRSNSHTCDSEEGPGLERGRPELKEPRFFTSPWKGRSKESDSRQDKSRNTLGSVTFSFPP